MAFPFLTSSRRNAMLMLALLGLGACASGPKYRALTAHECMQRVMYFESNRSSPEGMVAVGTVVMNRLASGKYPSTVCGVIGQKNQFAPGVLTRELGPGKDLASAMATKVLKGTRHGYVGSAMFFHTAGMTFPYTNMHYLVEAGGNVFYEKRKNARALNDPPFRNPGRLCRYVADASRRGARRALRTDDAGREPHRRDRADRHLAPRVLSADPCR